MKSKLPSQSPVDGILHSDTVTCDVIDMYSHHFLNSPTIGLYHAFQDSTKHINMKHLQKYGSFSCRIHLVETLKSICLRPPLYDTINEVTLADMDPYFFRDMLDNLYQIRQILLRNDANFFFQPVMRTDHIPQHTQGDKVDCDEDVHQDESAFEYDSTDHARVDDSINQRLANSTQFEGTFNSFVTKFLVHWALSYIRKYIYIKEGNNRLDCQESIDVPREILKDYVQFVNGKYFDRQRKVRLILQQLIKKKEKRNSNTEDSLLQSPSFIKRLFEQHKDLISLEKFQHDIQKLLLGWYEAVKLPKPRLVQMGYGNLNCIERSYQAAKPAGRDENPTSISGTDSNSSIEGKADEKLETGLISDEGSIEPEMESRTVRINDSTLKNSARNQNTPNRQDCCIQPKLNMAIKPGVESTTKRKRSRTERSTKGNDIDKENRTAQQQKITDITVGANESSSGLENEEKEKHQKECETELRTRTSNKYRSKRRKGQKLAETEATTTTTTTSTRTGRSDDETSVNSSSETGRKGIKPTVEMTNDELTPAANDITYGDIYDFNGSGGAKNEKGEGTRHVESNTMKKVTTSNLYKMKKSAKSLKFDSPCSSINGNDNGSGRKESDTLDECKPKMRRFFTDEEKKAILKGYAIYGPKWSKIKSKYFDILSSRLPENIKDCYRNMKRKGSFSFMNDDSSCSDHNGNINDDEDTLESTDTTTNLSNEEHKQGEIDNSIGKEVTELKLKSKAKILALNNATKALEKASPDPLEEAMNIAEKIGMRQSRNNENSLNSDLKSTEVGVERETSSDAKGNLLSVIYTDVVSKDAMIDEGNIISRNELNNDSIDGDKFPSKRYECNKLDKSRRRNTYRMRMRKQMRVDNDESNAFDRDIPSLEITDEAADDSLVSSDDAQMKLIQKPRKKRNPFTKEEKEAIVEGVKIYGGQKNQWVKILEKYPSILGSRSNIDIKDCYRNLEKHIVIA